MATPGPPNLEEKNVRLHFHSPGKCYGTVIVTIRWKVTSRDIVKFISVKTTAKVKRHELTRTPPKTKTTNAMKTHKGYNQREI